MTEQRGYPWFKMKYLPKPEYQLLQSLLKETGCTNASELVAALLRSSAQLPPAAFWQALDDIRTMPEADRTYPSSGLLT